MQQADEFAQGAGREGRARQAMALDLLPRVSA